MIAESTFLEILPSSTLALNTALLRCAVADNALCSERRAVRNAAVLAWSRFRNMKLTHVFLDLVTALKTIGASIAAPQLRQHTLQALADEPAL